MAEVNCQVQCTLSHIQCWRPQLGIDSAVVVNFFQHPQTRENGGGPLGWGPLNNQPHIHLDLTWAFFAAYIPTPFKGQKPLQNWDFVFFNGDFLLF